jgi:hypothetical protein
MPKPNRNPLNIYEQQKLEEIKLEICLAIRQSMARSHHPSTSTFAMRFGTSRASVSRVQRGVTSSLTFNQLFKYMVRLEPGFRLMISI